MSKQQDELREKIRDEFNRFSYSVLGDYDGMPRSVDAIEKIINSEVQAVLDKVEATNLKGMHIAPHKTASVLVAEHRIDVQNIIEEVRKDYE